MSEQRGDTRSAIDVRIDKQRAELMELQERREQSVKSLLREGDIIELSAAHMVKVGKVPEAAGRYIVYKTTLEGRHYGPIGGNDWYQWGDEHCVYCRKIGTVGTCAKFYQTANSRHGVAGTQILDISFSGTIVGIKPIGHDADRWISIATEEAREADRVAERAALKRSAAKPVLSPLVETTTDGSTTISM
ncbi:hypothetical protein LCGC14_0962720 [marine sediment metagenome]|uniref:Uncharacterized protein n=1 Tax=marine sediment metagenome TaxID=412755 RepID=A0A0F9NII2_9ZZZZ